MLNRQENSYLYCLYSVALAQLKDQNQESEARYWDWGLCDGGGRFRRLHGDRCVGREFREMEHAG